MIRQVYSSLRSFKTLVFHPGLNILLCDKSPGATDQQTRNRAGKSSFIELVHFVCGGKCENDSIFLAPELVRHSFGLEMDVYEEKVRISRSASERSKIIIDKGQALKWKPKPKREKKTNRWLVSNNAWRKVLGHAFYKLDDAANSDDIEQDPGSPTFRSLFPYSARRESNGGMHDPMRNSMMQQIGNMQVAIAYLIGMDWTIAQSWETIRCKEKQVRELKRIVSQGLLNEVLDSAASLRSRLVVAENKLKRIVETLASFRVHEQYHSLEREASSITKALASLSDEHQIDLRYLNELAEAMQGETPPAATDLQRLYGEAGIYLPDLVRKRYEDVLSFHESIVRNRRSYLESESRAASERTRLRDIKRKELDDRRAELMQMLKSHGALDQFISLQSEHGRLQGEVEVLKRRFEAASQLESTNTSLESERVRLVELLRQEFTEHGSVLDEAIRVFSDIVDELYGEQGQLEFHATHNGPEVRINIPGDRSRGIGNMEMFCFDMMLQHMSMQQGIGPGFLIHDSHLFDGVDPRQTGRALAVGARLAEEMGFQYIVTLNSDALSELPEDFKVEQYILEQRLSDATEYGGLFGLRFEPPRPVQPKQEPANL